MCRRTTRPAASQLSSVRTLTLMRHPEHPFVKAIQRGDPKPAEWRPPAPGQPGRDVYEYYRALLGLRRYTLKAAENWFRKEHDREPSESELRTIHSQAQHDLSPRGYMLSKKGAGARWTDEDLAYLAVHHALSTGKPTAILSADGDVEEQFVKLLWLVNTHYHGMLIARRYVSDFASFRPRSFPDTFWSKGWDVFERDGATLIERGAPDLQHFLPPNPHCVPVSCWRIGDYFSASTFMAEQEMMDLLDIKDRTGGLSTDLLKGRNVHAWLGLLPLRHEDTMAAAVVRDQRLPLSHTNVAAPRLDVLLAQGQFEQRIRVEGSQRGTVHIDSAAGVTVVHEDLIVRLKADGRRGK